MFGLSKKPVTILTGYLGSGKTTVLNELLKNTESDGIALIVNDMGSVNIDASLISKSNVTQADSKMIELTNGCICCTLQEAFMTQVEALAKDKHIKRIIVEASGISNPASIADGFLMYQESHKKLGFYLDSVVTVVDADRIYTEFLDGIKEKSDERQKEIMDEDPDIINLIMDQIEFCNVVLLNKCDLLPEDKKESVKKVIRQFQRKAEIVECVYGKVNPDRIFKGSKFDYDEVMNSSAMQAALAREKAMDEGCVDEYGISSFVFEEKRPFNHEKFSAFVEENYPENIIRAKGYIWFSDDDIHVQLFEQAGRNASISEVSNWVAAFDEKEKEEVIRSFPDIMEEWDEIYGDRLNQIVFIGKNIDKERIISMLNECIDKTPYTPQAELENKENKKIG
ncbi:GTP-binding protein [Butyrivibrio sp. XB500-5]|uniref:CobW family GTP-binding protein n=1 Tax=Butyrivibrio sp. XB500-5 TaxID=2364880 RepID=UPI000EAA03F2|nr:GTP-binding protein [Butyrivibrio sp. XB500-5]RKM60820.1 GTP-binding protein [Butyrivibrio sp. XB500-5]